MDACDFILTFAFYVRRVPRAVRASYDICGADVIIIRINHLETILADNGLDIFVVIYYFRTEWKLGISAFVIFTMTDINFMRKYPFLITLTMRKYFDFTHFKKVLFFPVIPYEYKMPHCVLILTRHLKCDLLAGCFTMTQG